MSFLHVAVLLGLSALAIPPIVHLLNRRRFEVVDWAAMQFLQLGRVTRKKVFFEHILLMALRMALVGALVVAIASPVLHLSCVARLPGGNQLAKLAGLQSRDVVIIVDGSSSMACHWQNQTAADAAKSWAEAYMNELTAGDRIAVLQAKQQPVALLGSLTADLSEVKRAFDKLPPPRGGVDFATAFQDAYRILDQGSGQKEIILLTDGQRHGWADSQALERWQLASLGYSANKQMPRVWVVNVVPDRPPDAPNWHLSPLRANHSIATVGREIRFRFDLQTNGVLNTSVPVPEKVSFTVDESASRRAHHSASPRAFHRHGIPA